MMTIVFLMLVASALQASWMILLQTLTQQQKWPKSIINAASGFGALSLLAYSIIQHGSISHITNLPIVFWGWVTVAVIVEICLAYLFVNVLAEAPPGIAPLAPIFAPVLAIFTAVILGVDDFPSATAIFGILTIATGVYVLHFNPSEYGYNLFAPISTMWSQKGVWLKYVLGFALVAPFAFPIMKQSIKLSDVFIAPGIILFLGWGVFYFFLGLLKGELKPAFSISKFRLLITLGFIACLFAINNLLVAISYTLGKAAIVGSLKRLDAPILILLIYSVPIFSYLKQKDIREGGSSTYRIIGSIIAFGGALLIGLSR